MLFLVFNCFLIDNFNISCKPLRGLSSINWQVNVKKKSYATSSKTNSIRRETALHVGDTDWNEKDAFLPP